jgi:hypothetical protein
VTLRYVLLSQMNAGQIAAAVRQLEQETEFRGE